jgi:hypothetical protein
MHLSRLWSMTATAGSLAHVAVAPALPAQQPTTLRITRDLRIDGADADLTPIDWLAVSSNGTIAVAQTQDHLIRFFDRTGASLGAFGRAGGGPGEFQSLRSRGWVGDTLWVGDSQQRRSTLISPQLKLVRTVPWPSPVRSLPRDTSEGRKVGRAVPNAMYADGTLLASAFPSVDEATVAIFGTVVQRATPVIRLSADGAFRGVVAWIPRNQCLVTKPLPNGGLVSVRVPFCAAAMVDVDAHGSDMVIVEQSAASAEATAYRVTRVGVGGDTVYSRSVSYAPIAIPRRVADSAAARGTRQQGIEAQDLTALMGSSYPPVRRAIMGRDGSAWIGLWRSDSTRTWQVLDAKGNPIGRVDLPSTAVLHAASLDNILVTEADADGLQSITRYRVSRGG